MRNNAKKVSPKQKATDFYNYIKSVRRRKTRNEFIEWMSMHHPRTNPYSFIKPKPSEKTSSKPQWNSSTSLHQSPFYASNSTSNRFRGLSDSSYSTIRSDEHYRRVYSVFNRRQARKDTLYTSRTQNRNGCRNVTAAECNWRSTLRQY